MFAYEWDAATDVIVRSGESSQILGIDKAAQVTGREILTRVHPDDRERLLAAVAALSAEKPYLQVSYRIVRPEGSVIWVERNSRAHFDEQGKMLRIVGMVTDITERKRAEENLVNLSRRLIEAQEQERIRIARELHDDIGQRLALLAVELEELYQNPPILPEIRSRMGELHKQSSEIANGSPNLVARVALVKAAISGYSCGHERLLQRIHRAAGRGD